MPISSPIHREGSLEPSLRMALVGQAPAKEELRSGRPFCGPAGRVLDDCLMQAGILRSECFITNLFSQRLPNDKISVHLRFNSSGACTFESSEFLRERSRLREELTSAKINVVVPLGNDALYALADRVGITKWHGSILESTLVPGLKVIPTFHPSSTLRGQYLNRYYIVFDLQKALVEADFPELNLPHRTFILNPSVEQIFDYIEECHTLPVVGSDIEVCYIRNSNQAKLTHWALAKSATNALCIPFSEGIKDRFTPETEARILRAVGRLMADPNVTILGQNYIYDSTFTLLDYGIITHNIWDTLIAQALLFPELLRGLDTLTAIYTREPYYKADGKAYIGARSGGFVTGKVPEEVFRRYNCLDASVLFEIHEKQLGMLESQKLTWFYQHKCRLLEAILAMEYRGMRIDLEALRSLREGAEARLTTLQQTINAAFGREINPRSSTQLQEYFYGHLGMPAYTRFDKKSGTSRATCDEDAIKRLAYNRGVKEALLINEYRSLATKHSTFYSVTLDPDNRLRCQFDPVGAVSRLSSRKTPWDTGANMQNQPPELKACFIADEGWWPVNIDLAQAENRIVAYVWNVYQMRRAFETGVDVHRQTAALIFGKPPEEISDEKGSTTIGGGKYSERDVGKRSNHAFNYGLGADNFAIKNDLPIKDAKWMRKRYFEIYPEILSGHEAILEELRHYNRWLSDLMGYKRRFLGDLRDSHLQRAAYSFKPQSTVGNKVNIDGLQYIIDNAELFRDVELLRQVHDSIELQIRASIGPHAIAATLSYIVASLEKPLTSNEWEFVVPADVQIGKRDFKNLVKVQFSGRPTDAIAADLEKILC